MALVEVKCPNCGANLVADNSNGKASCIYCHTEFVVESESNINGQDSGANSDIFENEDAALLERADTFLEKLGFFDKSLELYQEYSMKHPEDYRGWWGIACSVSHNFTKQNCTPKEKNQIENNVNYALKVAGEKAQELEDIWTSYSNMLSGTIENAPSNSGAYTNPTVPVSSDVASPKVKSKKKLLLIVAIVAVVIIAIASSMSEIYDDEIYDDETYDDETYDDETYDDETYDDETYDDETYDDETYDDEIYDDETYGDDVISIE